MALQPAGHVKAEEFEDLKHDPAKMPPFNDRGIEVVAVAGGVTNGMIGAWAAYALVLALVTLHTGPA